MLGPRYGMRSVAKSSMLNEMTQKDHFTASKSNGAKPLSRHGEPLTG